MKRKIRYIGGAIAVALLAAGSPVIMPNLTQEISVKAADSEKTELTAYVPNLNTTIGTWDTDGSLNVTCQLNFKNGKRIDGSFEYDSNNTDKSIVYYDTEKKAIAGGKDNQSKYITENDSKFIKNQTYYRRVTFKLDDVNSYSFGGDNTDYVINTTDNTVTYIQGINVTGPKATATIPVLDVDAGVDSSNWTIDDELSLKDADGNSVGTVYNDDQYPKSKIIYKSAKGAYEEDSSDEIKSDSLEAGKNYYRQVCFNTGGANKRKYYDVSENDINGYSGKYNDSGIYYVQKVHINNSTVGNPTKTVNTTKGAVFNDSPMAAEVPVKSLSTSSGFVSKALTIPYLKEDVKLFYANPDDAFNKNNPMDGVVSNGKYVKSGTFYRSFTYTMKSDIDNYDFEGKPDVDYKIDSDNNQITYIQKINVDADKIIPKIPSVSIQVGVPTSTIDDKTDNLSLTDDKDNSEVSQSVGTLPKMLDSDSNYVAYFKSTDDIPDSISGDDSAAEVKDGSAFTKAGTYYRMVGFAVNKADAEKYDFNDTADGQKPIIDDTDDQTTYVLYPQKVIANAKPTSSSSNSKTWTYKSASGIVTTKNNKQVYLLKNQDNKQIENRGLAKNTAWRIDEVRTNQAGDKQYRVATGEWVNADDVVLGSTSNNEDNWTYTSVQGVVTTKNAHEYYVLYDQNNRLISNRGLAKDTSWKTNGYRTNQAGDKQYRVATNEWVNADDIVLGSTSNNEDNWTYTSVQGVVTTKNAHGYYVLYDQDNKLISNRGLAKDTSWKTNGYRTNQAGDKQYRVATNEWINNEDIDFYN
ncbi:hypothetical protein NBRC111452_685 [Companilactobacillus farciminis]|nr:hypothetical protein NBRC111452_685 [Companilactobacillus farciminis]